MLTLALSLGVCVAYARQDGQDVKQRTFESANAAVKALLGACKGNDLKELASILGPEADQVIASGDEVQDRASRAQFVKICEERMRLVPEAEGAIVLYAGAEDWPFPIPVVKRANAFVFDTAAGKQEILDRRIGRNELSTIAVCRAFVTAQFEYFLEDHDQDGVREYAQKLASDPGKRDGLYWEAKPGEPESPMGPLVADAITEGYRPRHPGEGPRPYHGYYFRLLTRQGKHAAGDAFDYIINGNMIAGFALIAYPAEYGASGIMTLMINLQGILYEKDLGEKTEEAAVAITEFDPDETWHKTED